METLRDAVIAYLREANSDEPDRISELEGLDTYLSEDSMLLVGGGMSEEEKAAELERRLSVWFDANEDPSNEQVNAELEKIVADMRNEERKKRMADALQLGKEKLAKTVATASAISTNPVMHSFMHVPASVPVPVPASTPVPVQTFPEGFEIVAKETSGLIVAKKVPESIVHVKMPTHKIPALQPAAPNILSPSSASSILSAASVSSFQNTVPVQKGSFFARMNPLSLFTSTTPVGAPVRLRSPSPSPAAKTVVVEEPMSPIGTFSKFNVFGSMGEEIATTPEQPLPNAHSHRAKSPGPRSKSPGPDLRAGSPEPLGGSIEKEVKSIQRQIYLDNLWKQRKALETLTDRLNRLLGNRQLPTEEHMRKAFQNFFEVSDGAVNANLLRYQAPLRGESSWKRAIKNRRDEWTDALEKKYPQLSDDMKKFLGKTGPWQNSGTETSVKVLGEDITAILEADRAPTHSTSSVANDSGDDSDGIVVVMDSEDNSNVNQAPSSSPPSPVTREATPQPVVVVAAPVPVPVPVPAPAAVPSVYVKVSEMLDEHANKNKGLGSLFQYLRDVASPPSNNVPTVLALPGQGRPKMFDLLKAFGHDDEKHPVDGEEKAKIDDMLEDFTLTLSPRNYVGYTNATLAPIIKDVPTQAPVHTMAGLFPAFLPLFIVDFAEEGEEPKLEVDVTDDDDEVPKVIDYLELLEYLTRLKHITTMAEANLGLIDTTMGLKINKKPLDYAIAFQDPSVPVIATTTDQDEANEAAREADANIAARKEYNAQQGVGWYPTTNLGFDLTQCIIVKHRHRLGPNTEQLPPGQKTSLVNYATKEFTNKFNQDLFPHFWGLPEYEQRRDHFRETIIVH